MKPGAEKATISINGSWRLGRVDILIAVASIASFISNWIWDFHIEILHVQLKILNSF